jgi:hypothetical protein
LVLFSITLVGRAAIRMCTQSGKDIYLGIHLIMGTKLEGLEGLEGVAGLAVRVE